MPVYALWNNKGGVGKSYLTFQIAAEYARQHRDQNVLVIDLCPQANSSSMLLGGMERGETALDRLSSAEPRLTIAGYIRERISSPYQNPRAGAKYIHRVSDHNNQIASNLHIVVGDEELEMLASRVAGATRPGPDDAWAKVHMWVLDLINDVRQKWNADKITVFLDCNPSFGIYTELAPLGGAAAADSVLGGWVVPAVPCGQCCRCCTAPRGCSAASGRSSCGSRSNSS